MTAGRVLLDTGPLVAILHRDDRHHQRCLEAFESFQGVCLSTEAVLTEAMYLLAGLHGGQRACLEFFIRGGAVLVPVTRKSLHRCQILMAQYRNVPMDFADATLVALAEEAGVREIFTLDRRGFEAYRVGKRGTFRLQPP
ncbi:MAG: type II toxin-antitoxin system VapC family toxin [Candidatus Methylomirabilales bacterium]